MLVEINLLPQREPRKFAFLLILSCLLALMVLVGGFYFWQINSAKNDISSVDRQIEMTKKIADKQNTNNTSAVDSSSVSQLKNAINWAKDYPIQTIPVMNYLSSLLPERGFIQNFSYTEQGTISLTVQFDSSREVAYFLNSLDNSDWIKDASLDSLSAAQTTSVTADAASGATASNNGQTAALTQTNPDGSTTSVVNQSSASPTSGTVAASSTTAATAKKTVTNNILPRYTGQFQITLNTEVVKQKVEKGKKAVEGVTGS
jgi:Tfp pilus assembly protein PilN